MSEFSTESYSVAPLPQKRLEKSTKFTVLENVRKKLHFMSKFLSEYFHQTRLIFGLFGLFKKMRLFKHREFLTLNCPNCWFKVNSQAKVGKNWFFMHLISVLT